MGGTQVTLMRRPKKRHKKFIIPRTTVLIFIFAALSMVLIHRLFSLQIIHGQEYADNFSIMTTKTRTLKSTRGNIYDRNGQVLASNELSYSITLEDSGDYASNTERNRSLNGEIYKIIQIIESNGDTSSSDFRISVDSSGNYSYDVEGTTLSRFKADVYGHSYIDDLTTEEANASAQQMVEDMLKRYEIPYDHSDYKASELKKAQEAGLPEQLTKEETLKIISVRYALSTTSFRKYIPVTIATDVSENTVAAIQENKSLLEGVDVQEDSVRVYTDSIYFAPLLGYTGKVSSDELADLRTENPDAGYSTTSIVGKSGLEKVMESTLQGKDGSEKVYVDYYGKVLQIGEDSKEDPVQGNNVYLTIDKDLQIACYKVLEQKIAGVLVANIQNIKTFKADENTDASTIPIPIYDVYYALLNNSVIDIDHFTAADASETEQKIAAALERKQEEIFRKVDEQLTGSDTKPYKDLSEEMQGYVSYIVNDLLMDKTGILSETSIDKNDETYKAWTKDETISLQEYLTYAASQNWIDISKFSDKNTYLDSTEVYQELSAYISDYLSTDQDFSKMLYKYLLLDDEITGKQLCTVLYEQGVLSTDDEDYQNFKAGNLSAMDLMLHKISSLEITPAQLALDPCSGSVVITDPSTGETLACVSYPGYDNNRLANNMDTDYYRKLNKDLSTPFYNKATQERTAPGSTFKPVTAIAGLSEGVITDNDYIYCGGRFDKLQGAPLNCWLLSGHGALSIRDGIANSCNVFFSETAYRLGQNAEGTFNDNTAMQQLIKYANLLGLDKKSGLEISEASPQVSNELPIPSAIGQGTHSYTTSQLARYATVLASSGNVYNLSLLDKSTDSDGNLIEDYTPEMIDHVELSQGIWDDVHVGMEGVITKSNWDIFQDLNVTLAGKTGTAQQSKNRANHSLFIGYAPADKPQIAWAIRIANGYASTNSELVAKDILNYYFGLKDETEILTGQASTASNSNAGTD